MHEGYDDYYKPPQSENWAIVSLKNLAAYRDQYRANPRKMTAKMREMVSIFDVPLTPTLTLQYQAVLALEREVERESITGDMIEERFRQELFETKKQELFGK